MQAALFTFGHRDAQGEVSFVHAQRESLSSSSSLRTIKATELYRGVLMLRHYDG